MYNYAIFVGFQPYASAAQLVTFPAKSNGKQNTLGAKKWHGKEKQLLKGVI